MNPGHDARTQDCACRGSACGCEIGDHCGATGCNYVIGVDVGTNRDFSALIEEPKKKPKREPNRPHERAVAKERRREAFGKQRPPGGRR